VPFEEIIPGTASTGLSCLTFRFRFFSDQMDASATVAASVVVLGFMDFFDFFCGAID
jgi:hypothetical protein